MLLLTFAHRKEASHFLKSRDSRAVEHFPCQGPFHWGEDLILISGEGSTTASHKLALTLGYFPHVSAVINLGIAGSLSEKAEVGTIYPVRTIYDSAGGTVRFHSHTSACTDAKLDLITADKRVLDADSRDVLNNFAHMVDREASGLAAVCKLSGKPFYCYKLISDSPGDNTRYRENICGDIIEKADQYSHRLFSFYSTKEFSPNSAEYNDKEDPFLNSEVFYLTVSMKRKVKSLLGQLKARGLSPEAIADKVHQHYQIPNISPKQRGRWLVEQLEFLVDPECTEIVKKLDHITAEFSSNGHGVEMSYDKTLEDPTLKLRANICRPEDIKKLIATLEAFDLPHFQSVFEGRDQKNVQPNIH